jgi:hypothetical protein
MIDAWRQSVRPYDLTKDEIVRILTARHAGVRA